jgi:hypothetical protein
MPQRLLQMLQRLYQMPQSKKRGQANFFLTNMSWEITFIRRFLNNAGYKNY